MAPGLAQCGLLRVITQRLQTHGTSRRARAFVGGVTGLLVDSMWCILLRPVADVGPDGRSGA